MPRADRCSPSHSSRCPRFGRPACLGLGLLGLACSLPLAPAEAAAVLDQDNWNPAAIGTGFAITSNVEYAQTIRAGRFGYLDSIELPVWRSTGVSNDLIVRVRRADGPGLPPSSIVLFEQTLSAASIAASDDPFPNPLPVLRINVLPALIFLDVAQSFSISLQRTGPGSPPWVLWGSSGASYANGAAWEMGPFATQWFEFGLAPTDFAFRTFMIPGPAPLALVGLACATTFGQRRRPRCIHTAPRRR